MDTTEVLKALADETRLRIVSLLSEADDLCACEIETVLGVNQSNASRHLARLRHAGVIRAVKRGQWVHYAIAADSDARTLMLRQIVAIGRDDLAVLRADLAKLGDYRSSGFSCESIREWVPSI